MILTPDFLTRLCAKCRTQRPISGGAFTNNGKRFLCKDCRPGPAKPERAAA
jgi:hypothetical protein